MNYSQLIITNYAVSWKTCLGGLKSSFETLVNRRYLNRVFHIIYHANFAVLRSKHLPFVYIVFYGGHVNCTGIPNSADIDRATRLFKLAFGVKVFNCKTRAIAATTNTLKTITQGSITEIKRLLFGKDQLFYVRDFFTGALIRFENGGSAQIFYSGKVNFLGAKDKGHLLRMYIIIFYLLSNV